LPHKAIFLDRDGVINTEVGFVWKPEDITFVPGIFDFCRRAKELGYLLIIVTNQSGIARGLFTEDDFEALMYWMEERFTLEDCPLADWYYCPHHPEAGQGEYKKDCDCRKPRPGMIVQAARDWDIDLPRSILIGDTARDIEAANAAGVGNAVLFIGAFPELKS
jgi:D-glycero-D-manno-heptose 1,7-bisphosphate phosphatase